MTAQRLEKDGSGYFLYHSIGQYPGKAEDVAAAMAEFAGVWGAPDDGQWGAILGRRAEFVEHWRRLIDAPEGTVTTSENVTAALYALIGALPSKHLKGRKLLVAGDCFPSLHFLLTALSPRFGFSLETVPLRQGASYVEDEDVIAQWDSEVGLALLTWVSSTSSHRADIASLAAHGRKMGSLVGVDITQAAGLLPFSVNDPAVDFTISTSLKWMCGTPGAGMLHVASGLIAACEPEFRAGSARKTHSLGIWTSFTMRPTSAVSTMARHRSCLRSRACRRCAGMLLRTAMLCLRTIGRCLTPSSTALKACLSASSARATTPRGAAA